MKKSIRVKFISNAAGEFERLNKITGEEQRKGIKKF